MDLEGDINCIKSEIDNIKDPLLIETFKNLLNYRKRQLEKNVTQMEMDQMIEEGESDIKNNRVVSTDSLREQVGKWK